MKIENHLLIEENIKHQLIDKHSGNFKDNLPDTIIIHYTAGGSLESAVSTFSNQKVKASAHIVIDRDGSIVQLIPFNKIAWHAGKSSWGNRNGLNKYSIGIEIVNPGHLKKVGDKYQAWFGKIYNKENIIKAIHRNENIERYWHIFNEEQINSVKNVCERLIDEYNIQEILGHEEISPLRKTDPGPAFPLDKLRETIFNDRKEENEEPIEFLNGVVSASELNIRKGPGVSYDKINSPLLKGTKVEILSKEDNWVYVSAEINGWVNSNYIKKINKNEIGN